MIAKYRLAREYYLRDRIKIEEVTMNMIFFKVNDFNVTFDMRLDRWNCTCEEASLWKVGSFCEHMLACQLFIMNEYDGLIEMKKIEDKSGGI